MRSMVLVVTLQVVSNLQAATHEFLENGGYDRPPWGHWVLTTWDPTSSLYFIRMDTWNEAKLQRVRGILKRMRKGLGKKQHPR